MKLKKLIVKNIASIEDAELNFDAAPLRDARIFLIGGDTGSGKSTILDAICLALYDETPRLKQASHKKNEYGKDNISAQDTRNLMRHGTTEAMVQLDFEGDDGKTYSAVWSARRTKNFTLDSTKRSLTVDGHPIDKKEIDATISKAVGLDFEQFCRVTMLAQGQFTQFLKSDENKKADILEKMTKTERYSQIGMTIFQMYKDAQNAYDLEKSKSEGVQLLSEEGKRELVEQLSKDREAVDKYNSAYETALEKKNWLEKDLKNEKDLNEAKRQLDSCEGVSTSKQFIDEERLIADWDLSREARTWANDLAIRQRTLEIIEKQKEPKAQSILATLRQALLSLDNLIAAERQQYSSLKEAHDADSAHKLMYENAQTIKKTLEEAFKQRQTKADEEKKLAKLEEALPMLQEEIRQKQKLFNTAKKVLSEKQQEVEKAEKELEAMKPKELARAREEADRQTALLRAAEEAVNKLEKAFSDQTAAQQALSENHTLMETEQNKKKEGSIVEEERQHAYDAAKEAYEQAKLAIADEVERLRAQLKVGDTCPVCGQKIDMLLSSEKARKTLDALAVPLKESEKRLQEAKAAVKASQKIIEECNNKTPKLTSSLKSAEALVAAASETAKAGCAAAAITLEDASTASIDNVRVSLKSKFEEIEATLKHLNEQQKLINGQNELIKVLKGEENALTQNLNAADKAASDAVQSEATQKLQIDNLKESIGQRDNMISQYVGDAAQYMTDPAWQSDWEANPKEFVDNMVAGAQRYTKLGEDIIKLSHQINMDEDKRARMTGQDNRIKELWPDWNVGSISVTPLSDVPQDLETQWQNFVTDATKLQEQKENCRQEILNLKQKLEEFHATTSIDETRLQEISCFQNMDELKKSHIRLNEDLAAAKTNHATLMKIHEEHHCSKHPAIEESETVESLQQALQNGKGLLETLNQRIGAIETKLEKDKSEAERLQDILKKVEELRSHAENWKKLDGLFGGSDGARFRNIAQSFLLENLLRSANYYLQDLTKRYLLECIPGTLTISLRDQYMSDMVSPVDTLSGGESFLVSLALALALASMSRQGITMDTLFIDEGFGTLSDNEMDTVMSLLERLQERKGKRVGIISHVKELRERIPVHVEVSRIDPTRSGIVVKDTTHI